MFEQIWADLEREAVSSPEQGVLRRRILPNAPRGAFLGIEKPSSHRLMLLSISSVDVVGGRGLPTGKRLTTSLQSYPGLPGSDTALALTCVDPAYQDMFSLVADDVAQHCANVPDEAESVERFIRRVRRWQLFLEKFLPTGLSLEAQRGLFGELWFLWKHVLFEHEPDGAVGTWTGPERDRHDFQFPACSVEVKTTASKQHQRLHIASERQLDDKNVGTLFLVNLSVDPQRHTGLTLPEIVACIDEALADHIGAAEQFEAKLFASGYLRQQSGLYDSTRYAARKMEAFEVREGFPRLTESDIPNGVGDVRYTVVVAECRHFLVAPEVLRQAIRRGTNAG